MELNNAMKEIEESQTFRMAMGMLLNIGNALNGSDVRYIQSANGRGCESLMARFQIKAFQLDYLSRASELKDPVHKYPLTHHLGMQVEWFRGRRK